MAGSPTLGPRAWLSSPLAGPFAGGNEDSEVQASCPLPGDPRTVSGAAVPGRRGGPAQVRAGLCLAPSARLRGHSSHTGDTEAVLVL